MFHYTSTFTQSSLIAYQQPPSSEVVSTSSTELKNLVTIQPSSRITKSQQLLTSTNKINVGSLFFYFFYYIEYSPSWNQPSWLFNNSFNSLSG